MHALSYHSVPFFHKSWSLFCDCFGFGLPFGQFEKILWQLSFIPGLLCIAVKVFAYLLYLVSVYRMSLWLSSESKGISRNCVFAGPPQAMHPEIAPPMIRGRHGNSQQQLYPVTCLAHPASSMQYFPPPPLPPPMHLPSVNLPPQQSTYSSVAPDTTVPPMPPQTFTASQSQNTLCSNQSQAEKH